MFIFEAFAQPPVSFEQAKILAKEQIYFDRNDLAEEAGVSRATIHNNHPGLAERIREAGNKAIRVQRDEKNTELKELRAKYSALRQEHVHVRELNHDMASEMATLVMENQRLRAIVENNKVVGFPSKKFTLSEN